MYGVYLGVATISLCVCVCDSDEHNHNHSHSTDSQILINDVHFLANNLFNLACEMFINVYECLIHIWMSIIKTVNLSCFTHCLVIFFTGCFLSLWLSEYCWHICVMKPRLEDTLVVYLKVSSFDVTAGFDAVDMRTSSLINETFDTKCFLSGMKPNVPP